ncbi:MAG: UvrD-helicase domain-containing protein [Waddliaceae bacterium]
MMTKDFDNLNPEQWEAVKTITGPLLVLAGAGSGKTRVVTFRIAHLLEEGVPPSKILGVTFTNKAAGEMRERVKALTKSHVLISTFHSLGVRILRESIHELGYKNDFTIYDEEDVYKLLKVCVEDLGIKEKKAEKSFKTLISKAKNRQQGPEDAAGFTGKSAIERAFPKVYARYQECLQSYQALDFDDLLYLTVRLFREHPHVLEQYQQRWDHLLVDEYQDTNQPQYEMIRSLVGAHHNLCVVGDPDQSIYSWRGANIKNILNFENDFPGAKVVRLEQNYRSRSNILDPANILICYNEDRYEKRLWTDRGAGEHIRHFTGDTEEDEARFVTEKIRDYKEANTIPLNEMAIFYRTNAQSRVFEDRLLLHRIPYVIVGGISFYQRKEVKDILAFLKVVHSPSDFIAFARTINLPKRGIGSTTIEKIRQGAAQENLSILHFCRSLLKGDALSASLKLTSKQRKGLDDYLLLIQELKAIAQSCSLKELVRGAIEQTGYLQHLKGDPETFDDRKDNLNELMTKALEWEMHSEHPSLSGFLEELSLKTSLDEAAADEDRINLMTVHNAKGLEFILVFLVGLEEDLFPHVNARGSHEALEEERRLCYVGMTRAKDYLYLTHSRSRYLWGTLRTQQPSRFLKEIPAEYVERVRPLPPSSQTRRFLKQAPSLSTGDTVFHQEFGIGIIRTIDEGSLGLTYRVLFTNNNQEKTLVAEYARLTKL